MPVPSKLSAPVLAALASIALALAPLAASAAASEAAHPTASAAARTCANSAARARRAADRSLRRCHARALRTRVRKTARARPIRPEKIRRTHSSSANPAPAEPASTPAAQAASTAHAATIAAVLEAPCQNTELTPEPTNLPLVRAAILCLINHKRAENSESPLKPSAQLELAAEGHCQELIADDYFAHVSPSGETPVDRIRETGYVPNPSVGYVIGENLAWGTYQLSTPQAIASAWFASPGHLANILESQYTETGIGVTPAVPASLAPNSPGATYAQEFGVIIGS